MIDWLMRPKVQRFRRWSFVLTFPAAIVVARLFGIEDGVLVLAVRALLWGVVAAIAWRMQGEPWRTVELTTLARDAAQPALKDRTSGGGSDEETLVPAARRGRDDRRRRARRAPITGSTST